MTNQLIKFLCVLFLATNVFAGGDDSDSGPTESLDEILTADERDSGSVETLDRVVAEDPCANDGDTNNTIYMSLILSGDSGFVKLDIISVESGSQAIVASYDSESHTLIYYQTAAITGIGSFVAGELITGKLSGVGTIEEVVVDAAVMPCAEQMVSTDKSAVDMDVDKTPLEKITGTVIVFVGKTFESMIETCEDTFESDDPLVANTCAIILTGMLML